MATPEATQAYRDEHAGEFADDYFRSVGESVVSSVGLGTYLGDPTDDADEGYHEAIVDALERGLNVVDTAINYRCQRSERVVGAAIEDAPVDREAVFVATKGGFVPFDGDRPSDPGRYIREEYVDSGIVDPDDLVRGQHCIAPEYLDDQLDRSLANLGLDTVDLYYVHNPATQLEANSRAAVYDQLEAAFTRLEERAAAGDLRRYGVATWAAFRVPPDDDSHLSFPEVHARAQAAADAAGNDRTHFGAVQLPFNLAMPEAATVAAHDGPGGRTSALEYAADAGIDVFTSASIMQGKLASQIPADVGRKLRGETAAQQAITFARSGQGVASALVGMGTPAHVAENVGAGRFESLDTDALAGLL